MNKSKLSLDKKFVSFDRTMALYQNLLHFTKCPEFITNGLDVSSEKLVVDDSTL